MAVASGHDESAPGDLDLVRGFINTADLTKPRPPEDDADALATWLRERGLLAADAPAPAADLQRAITVREALRALTDANAAAEGEADATALRTLRAAAERAPLRVAFEAADVPARLVPTIGGVDGALAQLLGIVHDAMHDGTWARLKACRDAACRWAYFDHSKNRSAAWCSMASCGNRNKARRRRAAAT